MAAYVILLDATEVSTSLVTVEDRWWSDCQPASCPAHKAGRLSHTREPLMEVFDGESRAESCSVVDASQRYCLCSGHHRCWAGGVALSVTRQHSICTEPCSSSALHGGGRPE